MTAPSDADFKRQYDTHLKHLRLKGLQPKTIEAYARAIRRIGAYFDHQIDDLSETQLTDYFTDLLESHSWSAVKLDLYGLKFYYTHVLRKPWVCPALIKPPKGQRLPDIVAVEVIDEDVLAPVTTGGDVIDGAGEFDTQWADHGGRLHPEGAKAKT
jgi:site-specific recombinase XerD